MAGINVCATLGGNTKTPNCPVKMGRIKNLLPTGSKEFTAADLATSEAFQAALQTAMLLSNSDTNKVFGFPTMHEVANNTGDPQVQALADGFEEVTNEALPKYALKSTPDACTQQAMASFNGWLGKNYIIDEKNVLWYRLKSNGGGKGWSTGNLYTPPPSWRGTDVGQSATTRITFADIDEFKRGVGALQLNFNVTDLLNLQDVVLDDREVAQNSNSIASNNVFTIGGKMKCEGTDIYTAFSAALNNIARWRAYTSAGTPITILSVALNAGVSGWDITLTSAEFNALASGTVFYIDLATPTVLHAAGVDGIEGNKIRFVKA